MEKLYIGNEGWTGKTVHAIHLDSNGQPHSKLCYRYAGNTNRPITRLKKVQATTENVTCPHCLKRIA